MPELTNIEKRLIAMDDRIDAYLKGQMTNEEEHQFLSNCKKDKELRERAISIALLVKSLKSSKK